MITHDSLKKNKFMNRKRYKSPTGINPCHATQSAVAKDVCPDKTHKYQFNMCIRKGLENWKS